MKIETPFDLLKALQPYTIYTMKELRDIVNQSHSKPLDNGKMAAILNRVTQHLESENFVYWKK